MFVYLLISFQGSSIVRVGGSFGSPLLHTHRHSNTLKKNLLKSPPTLGLNSLKCKADDSYFSKLKTAHMWLIKMLLKKLKYKTDKEGLDKK